MILLSQVSKVLSSGGQPLTVLRPLDLRIAKGQFVAVMGPSGSGKSTLLGLIAGLDDPTGGDISVNGHSLGAMNEDAMARFRSETIGFVFQSFQLILTCTALENVLVPMEIRGLANPRQRARDLLAMVGLEARESHFPAQLSGGEQQRVAIARAFACRPGVLLADEPTGNLDTETGSHIIDLLKSLHAGEGTTLVLVTHDPEIATAAERIIKLRDGMIVEDTMPEETAAADSTESTGRPRRSARRLGRSTQGGGRGGLQS